MKVPQFSLRELFLLVVIAAMGCGWWVERRRRTQEAEKHAHDAELIRSLHEMTQSMMEMRKAEENAAANDYSGFLIEVVEDPPKDKPAQSP
jgi:hypothetical protein